jgi:F0F1-type ATP synthase assembly protein I
MPRVPQPKLSPQERRKSAIKASMKYGGMAFQLFGACLLGAFIGRWLDGWMGLERPLWAVFLTILFMAASIYVIYRQLLNDK